MLLQVLLGVEQHNSGCCLRDHSLAVIGACMGAGERVLVVSFGSAPGVPNWGGLLPRIRKVAAEPAHEAFDILYVVDPERSWYSGARPWLRHINLSGFS